MEQKYEENELEEVGKLMDQKVEEEFKTKSKIIELLNDFGKIVIIKYSLLKYTVQDNAVLFKYAKERLGYIQDYLENDSENSFDHLTCFAFTALFLDSEDFKLEDLEERIKYFKAILDCRKKKNSNTQATLMESLINELCKKDYSDKLFNLFNKIFPKDFFIFIAFLILKFQESLFLEVLVRKIQEKNYIKIDFDYKDLANLSIVKAINDLYEIFVSNIEEEDKVAYIHLKLVNGKIQKASEFSIDEISEIIFSLNETQQEKKNQLRATLKKKKSAKKKISNKNFVKKEEDENDKINKIKPNDNINDIVNKKNNNTSGKIDKENFEKIKKNEALENTNDKNDQITIEEFSIKMKEMEKTIKALTEKNEKYEEYIKKNESDKEEIKSKTFKIQKLEKNINNMKLDLTNSRNQLDKIESELDTIKIREGIKAFIDYIYASLKLKQNLSYEKKIFNIYKILNSYKKQKKKYDADLIKKMESVIYNIYKKLKVGNKFAHNIDLNSSIIEQLFEITTDNDDKYENLKEILLSKTNIDPILKQLIENRKNN